jgi:hypothetical protein
MLEYVPIILGFLTGAAFLHARGHTRTALITLGVLCSGIVGTIVSGEYLDGWWRLPLDVVEAAFGLAVAFVVVVGIDRRARARHIR